LSGDSRRDLHTRHLKDTSRSGRNKSEATRRSDAGLRFKTKSGIRVRSKIEKIIADFLFYTTPADETDIEEGLTDKLAGFVSGLSPASPL